MMLTHPLNFSVMTVGRLESIVTYTDYHCQQIIMIMIMIMITIITVTILILMI